MGGTTSQRVRQRAAQKKTNIWDNDAEKLMLLMNVAEQSCNFYLEHGEFPTSYLELQPVPLLEAKLLKKLVNPFCDGDALTVETLALLVLRTSTMLKTLQVMFYPKNVPNMERLLRIVVGIVLIGLATTGQGLLGTFGS